MSGLHGIVMHWTAGGPSASTLDREHYHFLVQQDGKVVTGIRTPEDNISCADGKYAAHTLSANTGRIGVGLCGMVGAVEFPFTAGRSPITWSQIAIACKLIGDLCKKYQIPVTRQTVLSHAEVQPTLGIKQRGKWDIAWLPGMDRPDNPITIGDRLRADIIKAMKG